MSPTKYLLENWLWLSLSLAGLCLAYFVVILIQHRRFYADLPTPPHSMILGNLKVMGDYMKKYPSDFHPQPMFTDIAFDNNLQGVYYMDLFPFNEPFILLLDPAVAMQAQADPIKFPRHPMAVNFLGGIVGKKSLFSTMGAEWQHQRAWFSPAFAMSNLLNMVPAMVEETLVFKEKLTRYAVTGEVFSLNDTAMRLAIDFIGRTVIDTRLKSQTDPSPIYEAFQSAMGWTAGYTEPIWKRIMSPFMMAWYTSILDKHLGAVIKEKLKTRKEDSVDKSILDLALRGYLKDTGKVGEGKSVRADLDREFVQVALDNAKTFLAGGHDTTAALVTYHFYLLSQHPDILARVREEHNQVFGSDLESTLSNIRSEPTLFNKCHLTNAVLKEVLRLHPVGFTIRTSQKGATVTYQGREYPTEGHVVIVLGTYMHRDPTVWANPNEFDPDRWLKPDTHSNASWQGFEKGPRNCIGQQLAMLEAKVISVLITRWFDFEPVFKDHGLSIPNYGGRAYQELRLTAKPKDGIPMRAKLVAV